jgi:hypothetical protein
MRNTHTLTHKSGHLFASSLLVLLFIMAAGDCLSVKARITSSSALKCTAIGANTLLSPLSCNQIHFVFAEIPTTGGLSQSFMRLESAGNYQPLSIRQLFAGYLSIGKAVRLVDAAVMSNCPVPCHGPGRARCGNAGQHRLNGVSKAENSVLGIDDDGAVTACPRSQNPQSELSQCHPSGTLLSFVFDLSAEVFSIGSQVLKVTEA